MKCPNPKCEDGEVIENCRFVDCPRCDGTGVILNLPPDIPSLHGEPVRHGSTPQDWSDV